MDVCRSGSFERKPETSEVITVYTFNKAPNLSDHPANNLQSDMSTMQSQLTKLLSRVPSEYSPDVFYLFTILPPEYSYLFCDLFLAIIEYLPITLPRALKKRPPKNPNLPNNFPNHLNELTKRLKILHSTMITVTRLRLLSPNLSLLCSNLLDDLHITLYTHRRYLIPAQLNSLRTIPSNLPLPQPSLERDNRITNFLEILMSDIRFMLSDRYALPMVQPGDRLWNLKILTHRLRSTVIRLHRQLQTYQQNYAAANASDIDQITTKYVYEASGHGETDPEKCRICLVEMQDGDNARRLGCLHNFHMDCIDRWLDTNATCPLCRTHISATH